MIYVSANAILTMSKKRYLKNVDTNYTMCADCRLGAQHRGSSAQGGAVHMGEGAVHKGGGSRETGPPVIPLIVIQSCHIDGLCASHIKHNV
jgi:hypothetical protein